MSKSRGEIDLIWDAFKKPMGPCIVSPRGGIPRVIEGHRGSLCEAQEEAIGYGWLCF